MCHVMLLKMVEKPESSSADSYGALSGELGSSPVVRKEGGKARGVTIMGPILAGHPHASAHSTT